MRKFDDGNSYILYDSAYDVCFQWEIIEIQEENLETVKKFIENCCSCIISNKIDSYIKSYLIDIGFKEYEGNLIYYPFGVVYRIDDLTDSTFYIGMCENLSRWDTGYLGSGLRWLNHINKHADHEYRRTILHNCEVPSETRRLELLEIQKYFKLVDGSWTKQNRKCMNIHVRTQGQPYTGRECEECGSKGITHKRGCSKYSQPEPCLDCGGKGGKHKKGCPKYKETKICDECGSVNGKHKKGCSHFKPNKPCPDCGSTGGHRKDCPRYNQPDPCPECGTINGHVKRCSRYNKNNNVNNLEEK